MKTPQFEGFVLLFPQLNRGIIMTRFIEGVGRDQVTLLPECLDDYVESAPLFARHGDRSTIAARVSRHNNRAGEFIVYWADATA